MDILQAMLERHSVRSYTDKKIDGKVKTELESLSVSVISKAVCQCSL